MNTIVPNAKVLRDNDKFVEAAANGDTKEVAWRLLHGQQVNCRHAYLELTALMAASRSGHRQVVMLLLEESASVDLAHRKSGYTALHYASSAGRPDVVKILLSAGANKSTRTKGGGSLTKGRLTALQVAECFQKEDVRALLRDPPCIMEVPLVTHYSKYEFGILWSAPISKGADLDGYRMLLRTHPGGFTAPTPEDFHHPHSLPDEPSGWGDVIQLPATLTKVLLSLEKRLKRALRRRAAAKNMTVVDIATANGENAAAADGTLVEGKQDVAVSNQDEEKEKEEKEEKEENKVEEEESMFDQEDEPQKEELVYNEETGDYGPLTIPRGLHTMFNLAPATDYTFAMRAHNAAGWSPLGKIICIFILRDN